MGPIYSADFISNLENEGFSFFSVHGTTRHSACKTAPGQNTKGPLVSVRSVVITDCVMYIRAVVDPSKSRFTDPINKLIPSFEILF